MIGVSLSSPYWDQTDKVDRCTDRFYTQVRGNCFWVGTRSLCFILLFYNPMSEDGDQMYLKEVDDAVFQISSEMFVFDRRMRPYLECLTRTWSSASDSICLIADQSMVEAFNSSKKSSQKKPRLDRMYSLFNTTLWL